VRRDGLGPILPGRVQGVEPILGVRSRAQREALCPVEKFPGFRYAGACTSAAADLVQNIGNIKLPKTKHGRPISRCHSLPHFIGAPGIHTHVPLAYIWSAVCSASKTLVM